MAGNDGLPRSVLARLAALAGCLALAACTVEIPGRLPPIVERAEWGARSPGDDISSYRTYGLAVPAYERVVLHVTAMGPGTGVDEIRRIQDFHLDERGFADIGYNFLIDSAGTGGWHVGERAHRDTRAAASARGIEVTSIARQFKREDFDRFDYVVAMDRSNRENLRRLAGSTERTVHLFRDFDPDSEKGSEVPDPYYSGGFDAVYDICEAAARGFLDELRDTHGL